MDGWAGALAGMSLVGCGFDQVGTTLRRLITHFPGALGRVARAVQQSAGQHQRDGRGPNRDLCPLPLCLYSVEQLTEGGIPPGASLAESYLKAQADAIKAVQDWVFCMVVVLNFMNSAHGTASMRLMEGSRPTKAQTAALRHLHWSAAYRCASNERIAERDWPGSLHGYKFSYAGKVEQKAVPLHVGGVLAALPPDHLSGSIEAIDLADGVVAARLADPALSVLPKDQWPDTLLRPKVRADQPTWDRLAAELVRRRVFATIEEDELIEHNGSYLLNGAFGINKDKLFTDADTGAEAPTQRLIINLTASNQVQRIINADIGSLPFFGQWGAVELAESQQLAWSAEDLVCCFYLFRLPPAWRPYFVLEKQVTGTAIGSSKAKVWVACSVLPMGWLSAVGVCQHLHRQLMLRCPVEGAGLPPAHELRKDRLLPVDAEGAVSAFWQCYIDNIDMGEVIEAREHAQFQAAFDVLEKGELSDPAKWLSPTWIKKLKQAYAAWGAPHSASKEVLGKLRAASLGAEIDGMAGRIQPDAERLLRLASLTAYALGNQQVGRKLAAFFAGHWVFALQFKRPCMHLLTHAWQGTHGAQGCRRSRGLWDQEALSLLCVMPLLHMDLRMTTDPQVTASDASEQGGGGCVSTSLTEEGRQVARAFVGEPSAAPGHRVLLLELFGGIGGGRRAFERLGVAIDTYVHVDTAQEAQRVAATAWPAGVMLQDVRDITIESLRENLDGYSYPTVVFVLAGSPCQDVTSLNRTRRGAQGERSGLVHHVPRVASVLKSLFPKAVHFTLCENVASMTVEDQEVFDQVFQVMPVFLCAGDFGWVRRPRLYWLSWAVKKRPDVQFHEKERWTALSLDGMRMPASDWLPPGYTLVQDSTVFPTFVQAMRRAHDPGSWATGREGCDEACLARWAADGWRFPAYQYQRRYLLRHNGKETPPPSEARELLMGFMKDHTFGCWSAADRAACPQAWEDARCALLGNAFHVPSVAWLLGSALVECGVLEAVPAVANLCTVQGGTVAGRAALRLDPKDLGRRLAQYLVARQTFRGGEIRQLRGAICPRLPFRQSVDGAWWRWRTVIQVKWKNKNHINVLELQALAAMVKRRARQAANHSRKWLHLVDSVVAMGAVAKGRSPALRLRQALGRIAATVCASNARLVLAHVRTHRNPADAPSRAFTKTAVTTHSKVPSSRAIGTRSQCR